MNPYREAPPPDAVCPRCAVGLGPRRVADVDIDECPRCAGVFVPARLMPRFLDGLDLGGEVLATFPRGRPTPLTEGPLYVKCPRCQTMMNRRLFAPGAKVVVDVCRDHGIWFDDAELRAVAEFASSGELERAAARDRAEHAREQERRREQHAERMAGFEAEERRTRSLWHLLNILMS